jgi:hypothetical protein
MASDATPIVEQENERTGAAGLVAIGLVGTWILSVGVPFLPVPPLLGTLFATAILTALSFVALYGIAKLKLAPWHEAVLMVTCGLAWHSLSLAVSSHRGRGPMSETQLMAIAASGVAFLTACAMGGRLLSRLVREPNLLLPVLVTAAAADVFTVFAGPTGEMLKRAPSVVQHLSMAVPMAGSAAHGRGMAGLAMAASIGLGDYIFGALFLAAAWRHGLDTRRAAIGGAICALIGMLCVLLVPKVSALPLLPFIAVGVLVPNVRRFKFSRQEIVTMAVGAVFLAALLAGFYFAMRGVAKP